MRPATSEFSENLSYKTPQRILAVFGSKFSTADPQTALKEAAQYVNAPEKLANRVYNRASLGNTMDGDGWRYHGRGILQLTGRADYRNHGAIVGDPLEVDPDLMYNNDVATRVLFSHFLNKRLLDPFFLPGQEPKWLEARAIYQEEARKRPLRWRKRARRYWAVCRRSDLASFDELAPRHAFAAARPALRPENRQPPRNVPSSER